MALPTLEEDLQAIRTAAAQTKFETAVMQALGGSPLGGRPFAGNTPAASAITSLTESSVVQGAASTIGWIKRLPKNIGIGLLDAAVNTIDAIDDTFSAMGDLHSIPEDSALPDPSNPGLTMNEGRMARQREAASETPDYSPVQAYREWRASISENDNLGDSLTQGIAQFAVPFAAWSKLMGGYQDLSKMQAFIKALGAESATAGTAWSPHDGRLADLVDLGRQSQGKFGEVLRQMAPDGSALNAYIDYMTDRDGETAGEGRFKNVIDNLAGSVAIAGLLKTAAVAYRATKNLPDAIQQTAVRPGSLKSQLSGDPLSGLRFANPEDTKSAIEEMNHMFGPGFQERQAATWSKASDKNFGTLHSFAQVLKTNVDKPVRTHSLIEALEKNIKGDTETGAFYKDLLGRLKAKNLGGMTTVRGELRDPNNPTRGTYSPQSNAVTLYPTAFVNGPEKLLHTFTHEAVHAATSRAIRESSDAYAKISKLHARILRSIEEADAVKQKETGNPMAEASPRHYGMKDPDEFIAEIESNPEFRKLMKSTLIDGESAWDKYKKAIGGILGIGALAMNPEFDKLMDPKQEDNGA